MWRVTEPATFTRASVQRRATTLGRACLHQGGGLLGALQPTDRTAQQRKPRGEKKYFALGPAGPMVSDFQMGVQW